MNIRTGLDVLKDGRPGAEISLNSTGVGSAIVDSNYQNSLTTAGPARVRFDRYVLDHQRGCLFAEGKEITLRPKTFEFLRYLAGNPGRVVSKDELLAAVWPNVVVSDDSVFQCVAELRRALQDPDQHLIKTVQRRGYRFDAAVSVEAGVAVPQPADIPALAAANDEPSPAPREPSSAGRLRRTPVLAAIAIFTMLTAALGAGWWWFGLHERPVAALPPSIVVLPFHNLSDDLSQESLAAGITADLTTDLSRLPDAIVIAHATALTLKGRNFDARQIGRDLNVRYLLEGSVHGSGNEVRINVQLIDASTGTHLWAERFERQRDQIAAWQDETVGRIANALNLRLTRLESERTMRERGDNPEAYDLTTRGWATLYTAKKPESYEVARALFNQALALDPRASNALAGLGWVSALSVLNEWSASPAQDIATAEAAVAQI
jgi:TolB-like protein/DNA-binding winged helix-turn-helix (wHTH) protein